MTDRPALDPGRSNQPKTPQVKHALAGSFVGFGLQFAIGIFLFLYLGKWIDSRFGTSPAGLIAGVFIGAAGSFYLAYRRLTAAQRRDDEIHGRTTR